MVSVNGSFSYPIKKAAIIAQAQDKAKEEDKSWSEYLIGLVEADLREEPSEEEKSGFIPRLFENRKEEQQQKDWIMTAATNEELIRLSSSLKETHKQIICRRDTENSQRNREEKWKRMQRPIPDVSNLIVGSFGLTTGSNNDNSIPIDSEYENIEEATDKGYK